jgi:hypothetical protein
MRNFVDDYKHNAADNSTETCPGCGKQSKRKEKRRLKLMQPPKQEHYRKYTTARYSGQRRYNTKG